MHQYCLALEKTNNTSFHEPSCEQGQDQSEWQVHEEEIVMEKVGQAIACYQEDYGFPTLKGYMILEEVVAFTLLGSTKEDVDSYMYWMDGLIYVEIIFKKFIYSRKILSFPYR